MKLGGIFLLAQISRKCSDFDGSLASFFFATDSKIFTDFQKIYMIYTQSCHSVGISNLTYYVWECFANSLPLVSYGMSNFTLILLFLYTNVKSIR